MNLGVSSGTVARDFNDEFEEKVSVSPQESLSEKCLQLALCVAALKKMRTASPWLTQKIHVLWGVVPRE
jgi:hypothetical protein